MTKLERIKSWALAFFILFSCCAYGVRKNPFLPDPLEGGPALHNHLKCEGLLTIGDSHIIPSGRDEDILPKYLEYLNDQFKKGGTLEKLGLSIVPQVWMFAPGNLVSVLSAMNMFPVGSWHDGSQVARAQATSGGILELVYPGAKFRQAIFRDDISPMKQISIINHVIGHIIFGMHTKFGQTRTAEAVVDSIRMYDMMERFYIEHGHDEVAEWYQFLLSLDWDQDTFAAVNEPPSVFEKLREASTNGKLSLAVPRTRNVLQYIVANLPPGTPEWKVLMARQFEKLHRYIPGAIKTKFMNEGFAVLMQEVLPLHSTVGNDFPHHMENCCLLNGVATRRSGHIMNNLNNPYFQGFEGGWRILREKYHARPELQGKTLLEKDRAFFHWAINDIIPNMEDADFFAYTLDDSWIAKEKIYLDRPIEYQELNGRYPKTPPPPELGPAPGFREIVTRDPQKIKHALVRLRVDGNLMIPSPATIPSFQPNVGILELENVDGYGQSQPLVSRSMVAKLWTMAQIRSAPVAIETTYFTIQKRQLTWQELMSRRWMGQQPGDAEYVPYRIRTVVSPDGRVEVQKVYRNGKTGPASVPNPDEFVANAPPPRELRPWTEITDRFQQFLDEHIADNYLHIDPKTLASAFPSLAKNLPSDAKSSIDVTSVINSPANDFSAEVFDHAPTVPRALVEYQKKIGERLALVLQRAVQGTATVIRTATGVRVRALPVIPRFEYNVTFDGEEVLVEGSKIHSGFRPAINSFDASRSIKTSVEGQINSGPGNPGDVDWGPGKGQGGAGEQDGEPQPSEQGEEPGDGKGDDGNDPSYVDVPAELWRQVLGDEVDLPNLRKLEGESNRMTTISGKHKQQKAGIARYDLIARQALKLGIGDSVAANNGDVQAVIDDLLQNPIDTYNRGLRRLRSQDWFVKGQRLRVDPDINVAVYIQVDLSGSMYNWFNTVKKMAKDLQDILLTKYKTVKIYFVPFDGEAHVIEDVDQLLNLQLGGGTSYGKGFKATREHMDLNHPYDNWDRIPLIFGDLIDYPQPADQEEFEQLSQRSQYVGVLNTGGANTGYSQLFAARRDTDEFFGYEIIPSPGSYAPIIFRALFRNPPK